MFFLKYIFKLLLMGLLTKQLRRCILERVGKELLQMSLLLLTHQQNYR